MKREKRACETREHPTREEVALSWARFETSRGGLVDTVRYGIIGTGMLGFEHIRVAARRLVELAEWDL